MNQEMDQDKIEIQMKIDADSAIRWHYLLEEWEDYSEADMFEILLDCFEKHENEDYGPSEKEMKA